MTTHPRPGTGLGLAIVAELVAAHGGTITLDASPGAGTSFTITLPTATGQAKPELQTRPSTARVRSAAGATWIVRRSNP